MFSSSGVSFAEEKSVKEPLLEELSANFFDIDKKNIQIKQHSSPTDLAEAGQGDPVFLVYTKDNKPLGVIKTISIENPDGRFNYKSEYESLEFMNRGNFKNFHMIQFKGIAETTFHGKKTALIAEETAKGNSLNYYLKKIGKSTNRKEREKNLHMLKRGIYKLGYALGELHKYKTYKNPSHDYVMKFDLEKLPGPYGIIHGDTHPGNIFFDPNTDTLSFIDFGSMNLHQKGAPVLQDAANFLSVLEIFSSYYHLSEEEQKDLKNTFLMSYHREIPEANQDSISFYQNYYFKLFASLDNFDEKQKDQGSFIQHYSEKKLY